MMLNVVKNEIEINTSMHALKSTKFSDIAIIKGVAIRREKGISNIY